MIMAKTKKSRARKVSKLPTRIWKFGAKPPEDTKAAMDQLYRAHQHYNALVAIENASMKRFREIRAKYVPQLGKLDAEFDAAAQSIDAIYKEARAMRVECYVEDGKKKRILPPDLQERVTAAESIRKEIAEKRKPYQEEFLALISPAEEEFKKRSKLLADGGSAHAKSRANALVTEQMLAEDWPDAWKEKHVSDRERASQVREAQATAELGSGTYDQVKTATERARSDRAGSPVVFKQWRGHFGKIAHRPRRTFGDMVRCGMLRDVTKSPGGGGARYFELHMPLIGRERFTVSVKMHRVPPDDAQVKWTYLLVRKLGERRIWQVQFVLEHASFSEPKRPSGSGDGGHIRIGWGAADGGVLVAWGDSFQVVVPEDILSQEEQASDITRKVELLHNKSVSFWRKSGLLLDEETAELLRKENERDRIRLRYRIYALAEQHLGDAIALWLKWKGCYRAGEYDDLFQKPVVADAWLGKQLPGTTPEQCLAWWLYLWSRKDKHLRQYAADAARRSVARRDAFFKREAIRIATQFELCTVDSYSIADLKKKPPLTLPGDFVPEIASRNLQRAAPGRFREILLETMGDRCTPCERPGDAEMPGPSRNAKKKPRATENTSAQAAE